jgi:hypothetical protein
MARIGMRGGAIDLENILGNRFKQTIGYLDANKDYDTFMVKNYPNAPIQGAQLNDIHWDFTQEIIAAAVAFNKIENPDVEKIKVFQEFLGKDQFKKDVEQLFKGQTFAIPQKAVAFWEFPLNPQDATIKHLINGFNALGAGSVTHDAFEDNAHSALTNMITYLYYYIALLDLNNVNEKTVLDFLKKNDWFNYNIYLNAIKDDIVTVSGIPDSQDIIDSINLALQPVVKAIISKFKNAPTSVSIGQAKNVINKITAFDGKIKSTDAIKNFIGTDLAGEADNIQTEFRKLNKLREIDTKSVKAALTKLTDQDIKNYSIVGLLNPYQIANGEKSITGGVGSLGGLGGTTPDTISTCTGFAPCKDLKTGLMVNPGQTYVSKLGTTSTGGISGSPFLYGPDNAGKQFLLTEVQNGPNTQLLSDAKRGLVGALVKMLQDSGDAKENDFYMRAALIGMLDFFIENGAAPEGLNADSDLTGNDLNELKAKMENAVKQAVILGTRFRLIPKNDLESTYFNEFGDAFSEVFARSISGKLQTKQPTGVEAKTGAPKAKNNLAQFSKFYENVILKDTAFYKQFFNLVDMTSGKTYEVDDVTIQPSAQAYSKYRLNVKKNERSDLMKGGHFNGGLNQNDILLLAHLYDYDHGKYGNVWISATEQIDATQFKAAGKQAMQNLAREVYMKATPGTKQIVVMGTTIKAIDIAEGITGLVNLLIDTRKAYNILLSQPLRSQVRVTSALQELEDKLSAHVFKDTQNWTRVGDNFVRKDKDGNKIEEEEIDSCAFLTQDLGKCHNFITNCALSEEKDFPAACSQILDSDFYVANLTPDVIKEKVVTIHPKVAFGLLQRFQFGSYLAEDNEPIRGIKRYKVQSVPSWVKELDSIAKANPTVFGPNTQDVIKKITGKDGVNLLLYFKILVDWVNANPQVLNPEETKNPQCKKWIQPDADKSFNMYQHANPYKAAVLRLRAMGCGLDRLKGSLINDMTGFDGRTILSNISINPYDVSNPLNRSGFVSIMPGANVAFLQKGGDSAEDALNKISSEYGYEMFKNLYDYLMGNMKNLKETCNLDLSSKSKTDIENKLAKFKVCESELRESMAKLIQRRKLYAASNGAIDAFNIPDENLKEVLAKHSNLLNLTTAYNKRAANLIDVFQAIVKATLSKVEEKKPELTYTRPLNMGY